MPYGLGVANRCQMATTASGLQFDWISKQKTKKNMWYSKHQWHLDGRTEQAAGNTWYVRTDVKKSQHIELFLQGLHLKMGNYHVTSQMSVQNFWSDEGSQSFGNSPMRQTPSRWFSSCCNDSQRHWSLFTALDEAILSNAAADAVCSPWNIPAPVLRSALMLERTHGFHGKETHTVASPPPSTILAAGAAPHRWPCSPRSTVREKDITDTVYMLVETD